MRINADYTKRVVETAAGTQWQPSPSHGVERRMLDRVGDEVAVATSVVRYAPGSRFPSHKHAKGEEFLVLDGVFSDAGGDYGPGTYVRNPPGTSHAPWTDDGTTILVKLRQFDPADSRQCVVDTSTAHWTEGPVPGSAVLLLHEFDTEVVRMIRLNAGVTLPAHAAPKGEELYVVSGQIRDGDAVYDADTWIRSPAGNVEPIAAVRDTLLWVKSGHLHPEYGPARSAGDP